MVPALRHGVYAPILTFFDRDSEKLDLKTLGTHAVRLAKAGLVGLVAMGSNGEAVHLSNSERVNVISTIRTSLEQAGHGDVALIAGCSAQGCREAIQLCEEAAQAGAHYAMILPPCYYKPAMSSTVIESFYKTIADASPIPILMYNYPGAVAGVDINSDMMIEIAQHKNVVGAKLTCANTGKLTRIADALNAITPKSHGSGFLATGGMADMTIQAYVSGGSGIIAGCANVIPKLCVKVWNLCVEGKIDEAMKLQKLLARADWLTMKTGIGGTKSALQQHYGYGGLPRRPLPGMEDTAAKELGDALGEAVRYENSL